jgi:hypothetical protein
LGFGVKVPELGFRLVQRRDGLGFGVWGLGSYKVGDGFGLGFRV